MRYIAATMIGLALLCWHTEVHASCISHTVFAGSTVTICTTCCYSGVCTTTCL